MTIGTVHQHLLGNGQRTTSPLITASIFLSPDPLRDAGMRLLIVNLACQVCPSWSDPRRCVDSYAGRPGVSWNHRVGAPRAPTLCALTTGRVHVSEPLVQRVGGWILRTDGSRAPLQRRDRTLCPIREHAPVSHSAPSPTQTPRTRGARRPSWHVQPCIISELPETDRKSVV